MLLLIKGSNKKGDKMNTTIIDLKAKKKELLEKLHGLKTKKAQQKVCDKLNEVRSQLYREYQTIAELYNGKKYHGFIQNDCRANIDTWFFINVPELNTTIEGAPQNAINSASWYNETCCMSFKKDQVVNFILVATASSEGIELMPSKIEGGQFESELYNELKKNPKLAFFRYDLNSKNITGLFV